MEVLGQLGTQTRGIERREGRHLRRMQTAVNQRNETRDVGGIEDDDHMLDVGTISPNVLTELGCDFGVAFQKVLACHAGLAGGAARRNDVGGPGERIADVGGPGEVHPLERAVAQLLDNALQRGRKGVVKTDVGRQPHHQRGLCHVGTDHAGRADDRELFIGNEIHDTIYY